MVGSAGLEKTPPVMDLPRDSRVVRTGEQRSAAKIGMTACLGALVATGFMRGPGAKVLHIWSGLGLLGFSLWHHTLYRPSPRANRSSHAPGQ